MDLPKHVNASSAANYNRVSTLSIRRRKRELLQSAFQTTCSYCTQENEQQASMNQTSMSKWYFLSVYGVVTANALVLVEQRFTWQQRCRSEVFKVKPTSAQTPKRWVLLAAKAMLKKTPTLTGKATERHFEHPCSRQQSYKLFSLCVIRVHNTGCHFFFFFFYTNTFLLRCCFLSNKGKEETKKCKLPAITI